MMGLQTWNSIRAIDFALELPDVDSTRIGVTGASGGGTQSMILAAVDERITAAMPCVMTSTAMQGGCTCENAPLLRIDQGNIDIAAAIAPRPLGLTAADDWTRELETMGYPALKNLYQRLGQKDRLTAVFHTHFPHNYNHVNRTVMYRFFNQHFRLGFDEPVLERDFKLLSKNELSVWNKQHPKPTGTSVGDSHEIRLLQMSTEENGRVVDSLLPTDAASFDRFQQTIGGAWETIIGRRLDQVGNTSFKATQTSTVGLAKVTNGKLNRVTKAEQLSAVIIRPSGGSSKGVVVWVAESGTKDLADGNTLADPITKLVKEGYTVISADLLGRGNPNNASQTTGGQRMWYQRGADQTWKRFAGYTYGYNHCLFVKRTHDVLTLIKHAHSIADKNQSIHLIGLGKVAGSLALAARSQTDKSVDRTVIDLQDFEFASVGKVDHPMFVPGAVKYFDTAGLLSLCAPYAIAVANVPNLQLAEKVFEAVNAEDRLKVLEAASVESLLR